VKKAAVNNDDDWIYLYDGETQSEPMTCREARAGWKAGRWSRQAFYWMEGMPEWSPALHFFKEEEFSPRPDGADKAGRGDASVPGKKRSRVLVVDDDPILCEIVKDMLGHNDLMVDVAHGHGEACALLDKNGFMHYDAVVTDYLMPDGSGADLARWIKQREHALQVVMLTAQDNKDVIKMGLRAGVCDFQEKPLRPKVFKTALDAAIQQTTRQREERSAYLELIHMKMAERGGLAEEFMKSLVQRESSVSGLLAKLETVLRYAKELESLGPTEGTVGRVTGTNMLLQGKIGDLTLLDLMQLLIQSGKTGELQVLDNTQKMQGSIYLVEGAIRHAVSGDQTGRRVLSRLLPTAEGSFKFIDGRHSAQQTIKGDSFTLLLEVSGEMDQSDRVMVA